MKITKRQLRRIIREAIDPRELEEPLGGWAGDALHNDPDYKHHTDTEYANEMAQADYAAGMLDARAGRPMLKGANDDYAAGYEDAQLAEDKSAPFGSGMEQADLDRDEKDLIGHT